MVEPGTFKLRMRSTGFGLYSPLLGGAYLDVKLHGIVSPGDDAFDAGDGVELDGVAARRRVVTRSRVSDWLRHGPHRLSSDHILAVIGWPGVSDHTPYAGCHSRASSWLQGPHWLSSTGVLMHIASEKCKCQPSLTMP
jgi:hypothetical protein